MLTFCLQVREVQQTARIKKDKCSELYGRRYNVRFEGTIESCQYSNLRDKRFS